MSDIKSIEGLLHMIVNADGTLAAPSVVSRYARALLAQETAGLQDQIAKLEAKLEAQKKPLLDIALLLAKQLDVQIDRNEAALAAQGAGKSGDVNDWFLSLTEGKQKALIDEKWMLAQAAYTAGLNAAQGAGEPKYLVATGEVVGDEETYTVHDKPMPMADNWTLYTRPPAAEQAEALKDAERYREMRNNFEEYADILKFESHAWIDATLDAAIDAAQGEGRT